MEILNEKYQLQEQSKENEALWYDIGSSHITLDAAIRYRDMSYIPRLDKRCKKPIIRVSKITLLQETVA